MDSERKARSGGREFSTLLSCTISTLSAITPRLCCSKATQHTRLSSVITSTHHPPGLTSSPRAAPDANRPARQSGSTGGFGLVASGGTAPS